MKSMSAAPLPVRKMQPDRRLAPRTPGSGPVELVFDTPARLKVAAELVESSATGFRVAHDAQDLVPGCEVSYRSLAASGRARVVWTQVLAGRCVSGLLRL